MNTSLGEKLNSALQTAEENKKAEENNPKNFIWKGPKQMINGELVQEETRLIDATAEQLNKYLDHCISMLTSNDKTNPGRLVLKNIINDQRERCNTEIFMRFVEGSYRPDPNRNKYPRFEFLKGLKTFMTNNPTLFPKDKLDQVLITNFIPVPEEFKNLTIDLVQDGCLTTPLGILEKKHITLTFITKLGLWLDDKEKKEFNDEAKLTGKSRIDLIKERCNLRPTTNIKISSKGLLNFKEFKAMIGLKTKRYADLTTDQLVVLRDKVLFALENEVDYHISQWVNKIKEIKQVADLNGITLTNYDSSLLS